MNTDAPHITVAVKSQSFTFVHDKIALLFSLKNTNEGRVGTDGIRKYCKGMGAMQFASATEFTTRQTLRGH